MDLLHNQINLKYSIRVATIIGCDIGVEKYQGITIQINEVNHKSEFALYNKCVRNLHLFEWPIV
jgi:hypothetical protein